MRFGAGTALAAGMAKKGPLSSRLPASLGSRPESRQRPLLLVFTPQVVNSSENKNLNVAIVGELLLGREAV